MRRSDEILFMNKEDRKTLKGQLKLKVGVALIIFVVISLIILIISLLMTVIGNPSPGILERTGVALSVLMILILTIFRKNILILIDLIESQKILINYNGFQKGIDKNEFINMTELLLKLSNSGNFNKINFNESFKVELSKCSKEILRIEQLGKVIFPNKELQD